MPDVLRRRQRESQPAKRSNEAREREAHNRVKVAVDSLDERCRAPLYSIGARFVHRLTRGDVFRDFGFRESEEGDRRTARFLYGNVAPVNYAVRGVHEMPASRKHAQHGGGFGGFAWFSKREPIQIDNGVRGDNDVAAERTGNVASLFASVASRQIQRRCGGVGGFAIPARLHVDFQAEGAQYFKASRRGACKYHSRERNHWYVTPDARTYPPS